MKVILKLLITTVAILLVAYFVPGVTVDGFYTAFIVALVLGLINITIRPLLILLTLPITVLTLGLFTFVINGALFWLVSTVIKGFNVSGFGTAFLGALIVALFSWLGEHLFLHKE